MNSLYIMLLSHAIDKFDGTIKYKDALDLFLQN